MSAEQPNDDELAKLLTRIKAGSSPFYRRRLSECDSHDAVALKDLSLTRRDEILRDQLEHLPHGTRRFSDVAPPVRVGVTGTGDDLLVLSWSAADLARERAAGSRLLRRLGVAPGMRVANTLAGALATPGALLLGDVIEDIGALDVPLGHADTASVAGQAWDLVDRIQPEILIVDAGSAVVFFSAAPEIARPWWQGIIALRTTGTELSTAPPSGFAGWQRAWLAIPEATCFVAYSCAASRFHVDEGVVVEVMDERTGSAAAAGQTGTLVLTPVGFDTPLLRYDTGMKTRAITPPCACGTGGIVLELA